MVRLISFSACTPLEYVLLRFSITNCIFCRFRIWSHNGEIKSGAFVDFCFEPYAAVMSFYDPFDEGKAYARAFEVFRLVQSLKDAEDFVGELHIEPNPVIPNEEYSFSVLVKCADVDFGRIELTGIF